MRLPQVARAALLVVLLACPAAAGIQDSDAMQSAIRLLLQQRYPLVPGRWPAPQTVLTLPERADGEGYYYPDIQASFPEVDWQELDRLYIPAGSYKFINIGNLPQRSSSRPLIITNYRGQVQVGGYGHHYLFTLGGGRNWVLTGRHDPLAQTGDGGYPGHWRGNYAGSRGRYGFLVDDDQSGPSGLGIGRGASDFEVEFVEVREVGFAGMTIKTDDDGLATMENVSIHDNYIHDTLSEGFYIGSTQAQPQHLLRRMEIYNNRVIRTGTEAIQLGQLGGDVRVHHNVFALSAIHWKDAFQAWQDGNLQIYNRTGDLEIADNIFIGAAGNMVFVTTAAVSGDQYPAISTIRFRGNWFQATRHLFWYLRNDAFPGVVYEVAGNRFSDFTFQRQEIDPGATAPTHMIRSFTPAPLIFTGNRWDGALDFANQLATGNGVNGNVSGSGNELQTLAPLRFIDSGLPADFDYLKVEVWAATASRGGDQPVSYQEGDIVMHVGVPYRCRQAACGPGLVPPDNAEVWQRLGYFADDWRVQPESGYPDLGLLY